MGKNAEVQAKLEKEAIVTKRCVHQGVIFRVDQDLFELEGKPRQWDLVVHPGGAAVLPIDKERNLILIEQWRRAIGKISIEIPAGCIDPHESPLVTAARELREETGFEAKILIPLGGAFVSPGMSNEFVHLFLAKDLHPNPLTSDDTPFIDLRRLSLNEALQMIDAGVLVDAKTIIAILKYARSL